MNPKISAHLSTLFSRVRGVDFQKVEDLGPENLQAIIYHLNDRFSYLHADIEKIEDRILKLSAIDVMEVSELGSLLSHKNLVFSNYKFIQKSIQSLLVKKKDSKPLLPILRDEGHYRVGEDLMVFVGKEVYGDVTGINSQFNWVSAKLLTFLDDDRIHLFFREEITDNKDTEGRYGHCYSYSPTVFTRKEFFEIRKLLSSDVESDVEFSKIFLQNWADYNIKDSETVRKIILDPNVDTITDEEIAKTDEQLIKKFSEISTKGNFFNHKVNEMAKQKGIKL